MGLRFWKHTAAVGLGLGVAMAFIHQPAAAGNGQGQEDEGGIILLPDQQKIAGQTLAAMGSPAERPQSQRIREDVFGPKGGWLHPSISVTGEENDNIFNTADNEVSDFITTVSPGVLLSNVGMQAGTGALETSSRMPGGRVLPEGAQEELTRLQARMFYDGDFSFHASHSEEDTEHHRLGGLLQYLFPGGLTVGVSEQYEQGYDPRGSGISTQLDRYSTNYAACGFSYGIAEWYGLRGEYGNFLVDYRDDRNQFRDRDDNSAALSLYYKLTSRTEIYTQYRFVDISYDTSTEADSSQQDLGLGVSWEITGKSSGVLQAGYAKKDFANPAIPDNTAASMMLRVKHNFTDNTSLQLAGYRTLSEADIANTDSILTSRIAADYRQALTADLAVLLNVSYSRDEYQGLLSFGGQTTERRDDYYGIRPALAYGFGRWWRAELAYQYLRRESNFSEFSYTTNSVMILLGYAM